MPEYLSPGVYIEEPEPGPQPLEGVSTSTTGAVGVTAFGPTSGKPVLITSFLDFQRQFGGFLPTPAASIVNQWSVADEGGWWWKFPLAVKGFFDNGGQRLYIKRVFSSAATASTGALGAGLAALVLANVTASGSPTLVRLDVLSGVETGTTLTFYRGDTAAILDTQTVSSYDTVHGLVTIPSLAADLVASRGDFVVIGAALVAPPPATLNFSAASLGDWSDKLLSVRVRPIVAGNFRILFDPTIGDLAASTTLAAPAAFNDTKVTVLSNTNFSGTQRLVVGGDEYDAGGPPVANGPNWDLPLAGGQKIKAGGYPIGTPVKQLRRGNLGGGISNVISVWGANQLYSDAIVELDNNGQKDATTVNSVSGSQVTFNANLQRTYWEGETLRLIEAEVSVRYTPNGSPVQTETFTGLRLKDDGSASFIATNVNANSQLVQVQAGPGLTNALASFPAQMIAPKASVWTILDGGDDALSSLTVDDFSGIGPSTPTDIRGIQALDLIDDISLLIAPGMWSRTVQGALIEQCETRKDRFAILDPKYGLIPDQVKAERAILDTEYAALYYPWLMARDPSVAASVLVPPSGHMAGIYARVDDARGVYKAPANEEILGITDLERVVTKREQDELNPYPININVLRFFPDRGFRVWGARVLTSDPQWKYVPVRRLFIFLETTLNVGTQWVVFEPNDEPLWARVRQTVSNFLESLWRSGGLQGATAAEAFFVKVDRTTMTQDDIDNGRLIILVGVAPLKPAEFVIFRVQQKTLDLSQSP
jgi:phage tail sheath protein FI